MSQAPSRGSGGRNFIKASDDALTEGQKTRLKADHLIVPGKGATRSELDAFVDQCPDPGLIRSVLRDLEQDVDDYKRCLPSLLTDQDAAVAWDVVQFRTEEPLAMKHVVPGGLTCFVCGLDFERIGDKVIVKFESPGGL